MGLVIQNGVLRRYESEPGVKIIVIPNSVYRIRDCAFKGCRYLERIDIPETVTEIGSDAFAKCTGLRSVRIRDMELNASQLQALRRFYEKGDSLTDWLRILTQGSNLSAERINQAAFTDMKVCLMLGKLGAAFPDDTIFSRFVKERAYWAVLALIAQDDAESLHNLLRIRSILTEEKLNACIEDAIRRGAYESQLVLLKHKAIYFDFDDPMKRLRL